jgi:predicted RNA-binding protein with RPS1 domain/DNA-binding MarR family transcriptional regulator
MSRDMLADAARRHAHAFPGHILLAAELCAIPASALTVDVLAEQSHDLEASQKYTLRAMLYGIDTVEDLQRFLGLDDGDTGRAVAGLLVAEYIDYRPPAEGEARRLQLLPAGREAARDAQLRRPKSTSIQVVYDRLTNTVTEWRKNSLRRSSQAKSDPGRILMPPASSMPVTTENLSIAAVTTAQDRRTRDEVKILGVSGVTENRNFYHDAVLLVFKDLDSDTLRLGIEVDGVWSEPHAAALEEIGAVERLGLSTAPVEDPYEPVSDPGARLTRDEVITLQAAGAAAEGGDDSESDVLSRTAIRWLGVYEHPQWLDSAVTNSKRRLLIISPWIRQAVVNDQWVRRIEQLSRTVDVTLFWGLGDNEKSDQASRDTLHAAARRSDRLGIVRVDDTHAKVLVSDGYYIKTSFNWLSFRGDPSRKYRQEEGDLVQDQVLADRAYDKYMSENCAFALEVVGNLPAKYRDLVGSGATWSTEPAASGLPASLETRQPAAPSRPNRRREALSNLAVGQVVSGPVKNLTSFGAFVDLGEVDGLIHISQLAGHRVDHPSEVVKVGDTIRVLVMDIDIERERVSLSLKAVPTQRDPLESQLPNLAPTPSFVATRSPPATQEERCGA